MMTVGGGAATCGFFRPALRVFGRGVRLDDRARRTDRFLLLRGDLRLVLAHDDAARAHGQFLAGDERLNDLRLQSLIRVRDLGAERLQLEDDVLLGLSHLLRDVAHSEFCCRH